MGQWPRGLKSIRPDATDGCAARLRWISGEGGMIFPRHSGLIKHPDSGKTTHDEQI